MPIPSARPASRRRPHAAMLQLDGESYRLGKESQGSNLSIDSAETANVAPTEYGYGAADPKDVQTQEWRALHGGMGLKVQQGNKTDRTFFCLNADTSAGRIEKGPELTFSTPAVVDTAYPVDHMFVLGGVQYALNGRYCQKLVGTDWVMVKDFGANTHARAVIVFTGNYETPTQYAYVGLGGADTDPFIYKFDGTTWTQHAALRAEALMVAGGEFYIADDTNRLRKPLLVTSDPWELAGVGAVTPSNAGSEPLTIGGEFTGGADTQFKIKVTASVADSAGVQSVTGIQVSLNNGGTYSATISVFGTNEVDIGSGLTATFGITGTTTAVNDTYGFTATEGTTWVTYTIGSKDYKIVGMTTTTGGTGTLLINKEDQPYTIDSSGNIKEVFPGLKSGLDRDNGKVFGDFLAGTFVRYGPGLWRFTETFFGGGTLFGVPAGLERLSDNQAEVNGFISAFASHGDYHAYGGVRDDTGNGYLCKLVPTETKESLQSSAEAEPASQGRETWHGSITPQFSGKYITCLFKSTIGAPTDHTLMYCGFSNGQIASFILPCTHDPMACSEYIASPDDAYCYLPFWHGVFANEDHGLRRGTFVTQNTTGFKQVLLQYKTSEDASWTTLNQPVTDSPRTVVSFPNGVYGSLVPLAIVLRGGGGSRQAADPAQFVESFALEHHLWQSPMQRKYKFLIILNHYGTRANGSTFRKSPEILRRTLEASKDKKESLTAAFPDGRTRYIRLQTWRETVAWDDLVGGFESAIELTAYDEGPWQIYGTHARMEAVSSTGGHGALERTHWELEHL